MSPIRLAYGALHRGGARAVPCDLEGVGFLVLDGGALRAPDERGPEEALQIAAARVAPRLFLDPELRVLAALAGRKPAELAPCIGEQLCESGNETALLGVVRGGDVMDRLEEFLTAEPLEHSETGEAFNQLHKPIVAAWALLGHEPPAAAIGQGARVTLVGHARPAELAAAAWASASAGAADADSLRAAARSGTVLARVVVDADFPAESANADLVAAPRLVAEIAPGGVVTFIGDSSDSLAARSANEMFHDPSGLRDGGLAESGPSGRTRVEIAYREAYTLSAAVETAGPAPLEELVAFVRLLQEGLATQRGSPGSLASRLWREEGREDSALAVLTFRHERLPAVEAALARLERMLALWRGGAQLHFATRPQIAPAFGAWPTSVPSDLVEWSVDVRPAKDWLD